MFMAILSGSRQSVPSSILVLSISSATLRSLLGVALMYFTSGQSSGSPPLNSQKFFPLACWVQSSLNFFLSYSPTHQEGPEKKRIWNSTPGGSDLTVRFNSSCMRENFVLPVLPVAFMEAEASTTKTTLVALVFDPKNETMLPLSSPSKLMEGPNESPMPSGSKVIVVESNSGTAKDEVENAVVTCI